MHRNDVEKYSKLFSSWGVVRRVCGSMLKHTGVVCGTIGRLFPLTWMALAACLLIYFVWYWEVMPHANQILHAVVLLWLVFIGVIAFFTIIGSLVVYFVTQRANRGETICGKNEVSGYILSGYRIYKPFYLPFIEISSELTTPSFERREKRSLLWIGETLRPTGRGRYQTLQRKITVSDLFGLTRIQFFLVEPVDLEIMPAQGKFEPHVFRSSSSGEEGYSHPDGDPRGDLVEMRRYQAGDPLKLVLWKVFARSRKLVVRSPEPTISQQTEMFVYFVSGERDEASAAMARAFLESMGAEDVNMCFSAAGAGRIASDSREGLSDVIDSASCREKSGEDLSHVAALVSSGMMAHCFLLVPQQTGPWFHHVRQFIAQYGVRPTFVVSVHSRDISGQKAKKHSIFRRLLCAEAATSRDEQQTQALCKELSALGEVRVVDVDTGHANAL